MMEGPRHQHLHQKWQEPLEERWGGEEGGMSCKHRRAVPMWRGAGLVGAGGGDVDIASLVLGRSRL